MHIHKTILFLLITEQVRNIREALHFYQFLNLVQIIVYIQRRGDSIDMQIQYSSVNYLLLKIYNIRQTQTKF